MQFPPFLLQRAHIENSNELITEVIQGFNFTKLKFMINLATNQSTIPISFRRNAFDLIMQNAIQPKLPNQKQLQVTHNNLLYNEIIILFEKKKKLVGPVDYICQ